jgi:hypothetical protein
MVRRLRAALGGLLAPRTLLGIGAGVSLLLLLGSVADWREVWTLAQRLPVWLWLAPVLANLFGSACRTGRWLVMLRGAGLRVPWRRAVAAYCGSELLGPLPASPLVASYLLHHAGAATLTVTAPVVLAGLWVDVVVVVGATALVADASPLPVRLAAAALCLGALAFVLAVHWRWSHRLVWALGALAARGGRRVWQGGERWWLVLEGLPGWTPAAATAFSPRALLPGMALTAVPMVVGTSLTAAVAAALGYPQLTAARAWAITGTVMVAALASPLPFDLGVVEGTAALAYSWIGVPPAAALAVGLLGRFWGATLGLTTAALVSWLLRDELK